MFPSPPKHVLPFPTHSSKPCGCYYFCIRRPCVILVSLLENALTPTFGLPHRTFVVRIHPREGCQVFITAIGTRDRPNTTSSVLRNPFIPSRNSGNAPAAAFTAI